MLRIGSEMRLTWMKAVAMMIPDPKYLAIKKAQLGTRVPSWREAYVGKHAPARGMSIALALTQRSNVLLTQGRSDQDDKNGGDAHTKPAIKVISGYAASSRCIVSVGSFCDGLSAQEEGEFSNHASPRRLCGSKDFALGLG